MNPTISRNIPLVCATLALVALAGCSGEVLVDGASGATSGASTGEGAGGSSGSSGSVGGTGGECVPDPAAGLTAIALEDATSGVFLQETLHLSASVGGEPAHYTVVKLADGVGYVVNQPTDLDGPANLAPVDPGTAARVVSKGGVLRVELIDVSTPTMPFTTASFTLDGTVPAGFWKVFSVVDKHLFTCLTTPPATDAVLVDVPLDGSPPAPVVVEPSWDHVCSAQGFADDSGMARGPVWLTWGYDSDLKIFDVTPQGAKKQGEYNYNPDGIHHQPRSRFQAFFRLA